MRCVGSNLWPPDPQSDTTVVVAVRALPLQQRLVVDGGLQEGGGHAKLGEERVRFTLGVEMGDLVVAQCVRDVASESLEVRAGVLEGGPHHVAYFGVPGGAGGRGGLVELHLGARAGLLLFGRARRPEVRHHVGAVGPAESLTQAALVIEVCLHDFSTI